MPDNIVNYVGSVLLFWSLLAVLGVIVLRFREPNLRAALPHMGLSGHADHFRHHHRFSASVQNSQIHLRETLIGAATVLIGIPIYLWASRNVPVEQLRGETLPESSM